MSDMRGRFITFEGGEGCGKSTQIARLSRELAARGIRTLTTREPGGTPLAEMIRTLIKDDRADPPTTRCELLLFLAARAQLVERVIAPALAAGTWVLSDRFSDSTFAYQGYGRGLPLETLRLVNAFACEALVPDLTLFLDLDPADAAVRLRRREAATATTADRIECAGDAFHARLREGFRHLAAAEPARIVTLEAAGTPDDVWARVWAAVDGRLISAGGGVGS
jgi:dTMP kinase